MTIGQTELPPEDEVRQDVTWAPQRHTHHAQMVLKRCGKAADHTAHPYVDAGLNFGCDGKAPEVRRCPVWPPHDPHVWAISRRGIYDCGGDRP